MITMHSRRAVGVGIVALACGAAAPQAVDVRTFGAVGDGRDDTAALLRAHASGHALIYPNTGSFFRTTKTLDVVSDVIGQRGAALHIDGNGKSDGELLRVGRGTRALTITGMALDGGYVQGTAGEWSHLIGLHSASGVTIRNNRLARPYGDCIYVGADNDTHAPSRDIIISHNTMAGPRRCVVAIISAERVNIEYNDIIAPHDYVAAIDLEPNWAPDHVRDVQIRNNRFDAAGTFIRVTQSSGGPTLDVVVAHNRGQAGLFFQVYRNARLTGGVVRNNHFISRPQAGTRGLIRSEGSTGLVLKDNQDETPRSLAYRSVRLDTAV